MIMAVTYTWSVSSLERSTSDGMVSTVHWTVSGQEGEFSASSYGSVGLEPADPESMIPYDSLTPEVAVGWAQERLGGEEKVAEIEAALAVQIEEQASPTRAQGTPW